MDESGTEIGDGGGELKSSGATEASSPPHVFTLKSNRRVLKCVFPLSPHDFPPSKLHFWGDIGVEQSGAKVWGWG